MCVCVCVGGGGGVGGQGEKFFRFLVRLYFKVWIMGLNAFFTNLKI